MMKEESISNRQLLVLVLMTQIGSRVLTLPYTEAKYAGTNGWIAVLIGGCVAQLGIMLIWWLGKQNPTQTIFQYLPTLVGRPIGAFITFLFSAYFLFSALIVSLIYMEMLSRWVMLRTPWWVLILLFFMICGYAALSSLRVLTYISKTLASIILIGYVLIIFSGYKEADIRNLLPLWHSEGGSSFAYGVFQGFSACLGYELLLYAFPFVKSSSNRKLLGAMTLANGLTTLVYLVVVVVCFLNFTPEQMSKIPEPIVFILKQYEFKAIQSVDILFIACWIAIITATVYVYLHLAAKGLSHIGIAKKMNHVTWVWICTGLCFAVGCWMPEKQTITSIGGLPYEIYSVFCIVLIPLILLIVSGISSIRRKSA